MENFLNSGHVGRHETFPPRYGWLKKGCDAAKKDGGVFSAPDAIEQLGVGKNMVRAIRSWCLAFHLLDSEDDKGRKGQRGLLQPTELSTKLLGDDGWDPYLEDIASLWLLHWQLFVPPFQAVSWPLVFNHCILSTFDLKQLRRVLVSAAQQYEKLSSLSENSFEKDASCIIRMYGKSSVQTSSELDCPFSQIDIIRPAEELGTFRFDIAEKQTLPSLIFVASCFSYADQTQPTQRTLSLHKVVYEFNSPGVAFKISETEAGRHLNNAAVALRGVEFVESMGNRQLQFDKTPDQLYWQALECYYNSANKRVTRK